MLESHSSFRLPGYEVPVLVKITVKLEASDVAP